MAKKDWSAIALGSLAVWGVMSIPIITIWIATRNWILPAIIGVIGIATNIIIVRICINDYKDNNNERKTFFTKEELERFKRESKECEKYAK